MNPPPNPHAAEAAAAMREAIRQTLVNPPPPQRETVLLTWTRSDERTVSDDEIAAWYAVAKAINSASQLCDVLDAMQAATAAAEG